MTSLGVEKYHPKYRDHLVGGVRATRSLFPNYLFVQVDVRRDGWKAIASARGVRKIFMMGNTPARVLDLDIQRLQNLENDQGLIVLPECEAPTFEVLQPVRAIRGIFEDHVGEYRGAGKRHNTARVFFEMLARGAEVEMSVHDLVGDIAA